MPNLDLRVAFRREGEMWNAYMARAESMEGAALLGSIKMSLVEHHQEVKDHFMETMKLAMEAVIAATSGVKVADWEPPHPAPESERSGHG